MNSSSHMSTRMNAAAKIYTALILIFLFAPIAILLVFSFNDSKSLSVFSGFSLNWYRELLKDTETLNSLRNTLILALTASLISTVMGTAAAVGMDKLRNRFVRSAMDTVTNIPMINPDIITGISLMLMFVFVGRLFGAATSLNFATMLIAHVTFCLPYVILQVLPKLRQMDRSLPEAAMDLGCTPFRAFFKVTLPEIMPAIVTGMIMAFTLSLDDFVISYFTSGNGFQTLPIRIYSMTKKTVTPKMYALSTIIFFVILALLIFTNIISNDDSSGRKVKEGSGAKEGKEGKGTKEVRELKDKNKGEAEEDGKSKARQTGNLNEEPDERPGGKLSRKHRPKSKAGDYSEKNPRTVPLLIGGGVLAAVIILIIVLGAGTDTRVLNVYNWGEYISDGSEGSLDTIKAFEEWYEAKYGGKVKVNYSTFASNEDMYAKLSGGAVSYDVVIPSDYMIARMIKEDMLLPLDYSNIPNYQYIEDSYRGLYYDPDNLFTVPYSYGVIGIIYNANVVDEEDAEGWELMWNEKYAGNILQYNNSRDGFATAQYMLGIDVNSTDPADWDRALEKMLQQAPLVKSYVMDEIYNMLESGEAAIGSYYAGDYFTMLDNEAENVDLRFYYPERTNYFFDSMCIPSCCQDKELAEIFINFMLSEEPAIANAEYICYACPNSLVYKNEGYIEDMGEEAMEVLYPELDDFSALYNEYAYRNLDQETLNYMNRLWETLKIN